MRSIMASILSPCCYSRGSICCGRIHLISLLIFVLFVWKASCLEAELYHKDYGGPPSDDGEPHLPQRGEEDVREDREEGGLPMDGHLLGGHRMGEEDSSSSSSSSISYSCSCDDAPIHNLAPPSCRNNVHYPPGNYSVTECGARIFYLVGIHNNRTLHDALYLFRAIRDARNTILIHFDTKFGLKEYDESPLRLEIEACPCGSHVEVASVYNCSWGSWSMNFPTLWSMEKAVREYGGRWDVYVNLSGDTLPVYTAGTIANLFAGPLRDINFITSSACETGLRPTPITAFPKKWHKRSHYSYRPANLQYVDDDGIVHNNVTVETYFGSQWMALTPQWCAFLVRQLDRPDSLASQLRDHLKHTKKLMTDETFIPTLLMLYFPQTVPNVTKDYFLDAPREEEGLVHGMYAIRYERMDEHVPTSSGYYPKDQRYEVPKSSGVEIPRPWGPYFLG
jgi:Core-2/I-Branching enzyme